MKNIPILILICICLSIPILSAKSQVHKSSTKFIFAKMETTESKLIGTYSEGTFITSYDGNSTYYPPMYKYDFEHYTYTSSIQEVTNYNEDKKYQFRDRVKTQLIRELKSKDLNKLTDVNAPEPSVYSIIVLVFNSYKEASIAKNGK